MRRINTLNKATNLFGLGRHGWKDGIPGTADRPTEGEGAWFNAVQEEMLSVVEDAGLSADIASNTQMRDAVRILLARYPLVILAGDARYGVADPTGVALSTAALQAALDAYVTASVMYSHAVPSIQLAAHQAFRLPKGIWRSGDLSINTATVRIDSPDGGIVRFIDGSSGLTLNGCGYAAIKDVQFVGGANQLTIVNNNLDGSVFKLSGLQFHGATDWPVVLKPLSPAGDYSVNHLSALAVIEGCRWYNTNGCLKSYADKTEVKSSYATLFSSFHSGGLWQAGRAAFECRSLGDGIELSNFFGAPIALNGSHGNVWIDNFSGDAGAVIAPAPTPDPAYIGGTAVVSFGGGVFAHGCRFGGEEGGVPIVRNWAHGIGGAADLGRVHIRLENNPSMACGNGGSGTAVVILKKGVPNSISIKGGTGPVGASLIDASQMLDLANAASSLAYWLDPARNGTNRISVNIEGRNWALGAGTLIPTELIPFAVYDLTDTDPRTIALPKVVVNRALAQKRIIVPYTSSMTINAADGNLFQISPTNNVAFALNVPTNPTEGQEIFITIKNSTAGALGAVTWSGIFKMTAWTQPAAGFRRTLHASYNNGEWQQVGRHDLDIPN